MNELVDMKVLGIEQAVTNMRGLSNKLQRSIVTKAVRAGAKPWQKAAKRASPRLTGLMSKSMIVKVKKSRNGTLAIVGPRNKTVNGRNPNKYAHLTELGTKPHVIPQGVIDGRVVKNIQHPGIRPRRWLQRAANMSRGSAMNAFAAKLREETEKAARAGAASG